MTAPTINLSIRLYAPGGTPNYEIGLDAVETISGVTYPRHALDAGSMPSLTLQMEGDFSEFLAGSLSFKAANEDGFYDKVWADLNPYDRYPSCWFVVVWRGTKCRWAGMVDYETILFDRFAKTVGFTIDGVLEHLNRYSAESIRRTGVPSAGLQGSLDWGISTSVATNSLTDTRKNWVPHQFIAHVMVDGLNSVFRVVDNTATTLTLADGVGGAALGGGSVTIPNVGNAQGDYTIRPFAFISALYHGFNGIASGSKIDQKYDSNGALVTQVLPGTPATNDLAGLFLRDSAGNFFQIGGNTYSSSGVHITGLCFYYNGVKYDASPASGPFAIFQANFNRMLTSFVSLPTGDNALVGYQIDENGNWLEGDVLMVEACRTGGVWEGIYGDVGGGGVSIVAGEKPGGVRVERQQAWRIRRQMVGQQSLKVAAVGPYSTPGGVQSAYGAPDLDDHQIWLTEDIKQDLVATDIVYLATPYYRGKSISYLATRAVSLINLTPLFPSGDAHEFKTTIPYADFDQKSIGDVLKELAVISGCVLTFRFGNNNTPYIAFLRRDASGSPAPVKNLAGYIKSREDNPHWDQFYDSVKVEGADNRVVHGAPATTTLGGTVPVGIDADGNPVPPGALRFGGRQLEIKSDFTHSYPLLHQICNRHQQYYCVRRVQTKVTILGEYSPIDIYGSPITDDNGFQIMDVVALGLAGNDPIYQQLGSDRWLVVGVEEPLVAQPTTITLTLVSVGALPIYKAPDTESPVAIDTTKPEPPTIIDLDDVNPTALYYPVVSVYWTWNGDPAVLRGFYLHAWQVGQSPPTFSGDLAATAGYIYTQRMLEPHNLATSYSGASAWSSATTYTLGQVVSFNGLLYACLISSCHNITPPNASCWGLLWMAQLAFEHPPYQQPNGEATEWYFGVQAIVHGGQVSENSPPWHHGTLQTAIVGPPTGGGPQGSGGNPPGGGNWVLP